MGRRRSNGHLGTYRRHWVVVRLRDGEVITARFHANNDRVVELELDGGEIRRVRSAEILRLSICGRGVVESIRGAGVAKKAKVR